MGTHAHVNVVKSLWALVQGNPAFMRRINGWLTVVWLFMIPISIATGWIKSITYVSALSLWALVSGHWSAWQAARVEVEQQRDMQERSKYPPEERVVEEIIRRTEINEACAGAAQPPPTAQPPSIEEPLPLDLRTSS
jgi:hypothetical protein